MKARGRAAVRALTLACLVLLVAAGSARAEHHSYENRTFERSPAEGLPGAVIQVWGTGCIENGKPYENASVWLVNRAFDAPLQRYAIRSDGTWGGDFTVPREAPPGDYRLDANCRADDMVFPIGYQDFRVLDPSPAPTTTTTSPTTTTTTSSSTSTPMSRTATSKPASSPPSTDPALASPPPSEPTVESPPSVPVAVAKPPEEPSDGGDSPVPVVLAAALVMVGGTLGALRLRRRKTPSE